VSVKSQISITLFTASRADYSHIKYLLREFKQQENLFINLVVGGGHLMEDQGNTVQEIIDDGSQINYCFDYLIDVSKIESQAIGNGNLQIQFANYLKENKTDILFVVGDRIELLSIVSTALIMGVPIAHIAGGELTEGAIDNQVRNAISMMSHVHFTTTHQNKLNLIKMGEESWRICVCGDPGLESTFKLNLKSKPELFEMLGLDFEKKTILCTFHPETISRKTDEKFIQSLCQNFLDLVGYQVVFTAANTDYEGDLINQIVIEFAQKNRNIFYFKSFGKNIYSNMMSCSDLMIGNSSSGIIESQSFGIPVINVGNRQKGRLRNTNVIDVDVDVEGIMTTIVKLENNELSLNLNPHTNIYYIENSCKKITEFINEIDFSKLLFKQTTNCSITEF
jgi:GDP/UDP-N,N'-diacetylbacillosamine 2-epimerase (hydrolysing)